MLTMLSMFSFSSCNELADCIASTTPELQSKILKEGNVGSEYSDKINSEVKNDPNDNAYGYYFNVEGKLPDGLAYTVSHRVFSINGIPTKAGTFKFKVILRIDPPHDWDEDGGDSNRICFGDDTTEKTYTIKIS